MLTLYTVTFLNLHISSSSILVDSIQFPPSMIMFCENKTILISNAIFSYLIAPVRTYGIMWIVPYKVGINILVFFLLLGGEHSLFNY